MNAWKLQAFAFVASTALLGCTAMPIVEPVETTTAQLTGIGDPFEFRTDREPVDVIDDALATDRLTFESALRLSLRHDPRVQAALARVRQAEAAAKQARLLPNPVVSLAVRFSDGGKPDIEASVAADLLSLLLKPGRVSAADQRLRKSTADALVIVLDLIAEVEQQYARTQSLAARLAIDEARAKTLADLVRVSESRLRGGEASRLDVLTTQSEQANLVTERVARSSEERQARLALASLIGQPSSAATWALEPWTKPSAIVADESRLLRIAAENRPEIRSIRWELSALGDDLGVARFAVFENATAGVDAERDGDWAVGPAASVPLPLFDTGQAQRELIQARIVEQRHALTRAERLVVQDVRVALEQFRSAGTVLAELERRVLPLQDQRLVQAQSAYRAGIADVLAVRLAEQDLHEAHAQQVEFQSQVSQARSQVARAVGGTLLVTPKVQTDPSKTKE